MVSSNGITSLLATQRLLNLNSRDLFTSLERLSTGFRINRASDDPAALITTEALTAELRALESEARALQRTDHVANVAEGSLGVVSDLLVEANGLVVQAANSAGLSESEKYALQGQLDSILGTIDALGGNTTFSGDSLLDGSTSLTAGDSTQALPEVSASALGLSDLSAGGVQNLVNGDSEAAQQSIASALIAVNTARAEIGGFQRHTIGARLAAVEVTTENLTAASSMIRDTNYAEESMNLTRSLILQEGALLALRAGFDAQASILRLLG